MRDLVLDGGDDWRVSAERSERHKETEHEVDVPDDASKDIGYPLRENGLYGSYPTTGSVMSPSRATDGRLPRVNYATPGGMVRFSRLRGLA